MGLVEGYSVIAVRAQGELATDASVRCDVAPASTRTCPNLGVDLGRVV